MKKTIDIIYAYRTPDWRLKPELQVFLFAIISKKYSILYFVVDKTVFFYYIRINLVPWEQGGLPKKEGKSGRLKVI